MGTIWLVLITGLTTGGVSCLAVQGGLLASAAVQADKSQSRSSVVSMFMGAKIAANTLLGFILGAAGSVLTITPVFQGWMQIFAGVYMLLVAANLLNLHPVFRHFIIQPPKFTLRLLRNKSKDSSYFSPLILGALTVLIPCGITQGMMVLAVASRSALLGAGIMLAFTLGTTPVFAGLGFTASKLMDRKGFVKITSIAIIILGILSINAGQVLRGSAHTLHNYWAALAITPTSETKGGLAEVNAAGHQEVTIEVSQYGYSPSVTNLNEDVPVKLTLKTNDVYSCVLAFSIPSMKISKVLKPTGEEVVEFTPTKKGRLPFSCSMGMYAGAFNVI